MGYSLLHWEEFCLHELRMVAKRAGFLSVGMTSGQHIDHMLPAPGSIDDRLKVLHYRLAPPRIP